MFKDTKKIVFGCWLMLAMYMIINCLAAVGGSGLLDSFGVPIGGDFILYYAASVELEAGNVLAVYDGDNLSQLERKITKSTDIDLGWYYPPILFLVVYFLGMLPYFAALFLWVGLTLWGYVVVIRKIAPHPSTLALVLAFPGTYENFVFGQNGFLTAMLIGECLLLLEKNPRWAGVMLGLLLYKPHLGFLLGIALVAAKKWTTLVSAAVTAALVAGASVMIYGVESWQAFFHSLPVMQNLMGSSILPFAKMPTVFAAGRLLGMGSSAAFGLQAAFGAVAVIVVIWSWRQRVAACSNLILIACIFLTTPYAFQYDLVILGIGIAWYAWDCSQNGWLTWEKGLLVMAWIMPMFNFELAEHMCLQLVPLVLIGLILMALRRQAAVSAQEAVAASD